VSRGKQARAQARRSEPATFLTYNAAYPGNSLDLRVQGLFGCVTRVLAHLMAAPKLNDCAVIGSSDLLRLEPQGELINRHQTIWRINNAPVEGFEHQVGNRTDVRFVNEVLIRVWNGNQKVKAGEARIPPEKEFDPRLCTGREHCYLHAAKPSDRALVRNPRKGSALAKIPHNIDLMPASTLGDLKSCLGHRALGGSYLSGGHGAVLAALRMCTGRVHLYGFMGECCEQGRSWLPQQNYKYHHTNQSKWVCCDPGREATQQVMGLFFLLEERGLLEIHMNESLKAMVRNESQQHRRYKWMRVFSQPDLPPPWLERLRQVGVRVGMKIGHAERMAEQLAAAAAAAAAPIK
jgi:hypothetical protein